MSWYISYYYDDSPYAAYAKQKADISNRYDFKTLRAQSLAAWRATYGGELSSEQQKQLDSYFNLISDNSHSFEQYVQQMLNTDSMFETGIRATGNYQAEANQSIAEITKIFDELRQGIRNYEQVNNLQCYSNIFTSQAFDSLVAQAIQGNTLRQGLTLTTNSKGEIHTSDKYKSKLKAAIKSIQKGIYKLNQYQSLKSYEKSAVRTISNAYAHMAIVGELLKDKSFLNASIGSPQQHFAYAYTNKINDIFKTLGASAGEYFLEGVAAGSIDLPGHSGNVDKWIVDNLQLKAVGTKNTALQLSNARVAAEQGQSHRTSFSVRSTTDIQLTIDKDKAGINMDIPIPFGISVKETAKPISGEAEIAVKTDAILYKLLHNMADTEIGYLLNYLYACIEERKYVSIKGRKGQETKAVENLSAACKMALVANGLIGQMTANDFNSILVVNGQAYSIPDVIQSLFTSDGEMRQGAISITYSGLQDVPHSVWRFRKQGGSTAQLMWQRSGAVQDYILNKVKLGIRIKINPSLIRSL